MPAEGSNYDLQYRLATDIDNGISLSLNVIVQHGQEIYTINSVPFGYNRFGMLHVSLDPTGPNVTFERKGSRLRQPVHIQ